MTYLLDTNICIKYLNGRSAKVRSQVESCAPNEIRLCSIVKAELFAGAAKSNNPKETKARQRRFLDRFICFPFDDAASAIYGDIRGFLEKAGTPIGPYDTMIAAIALSNGCVLATNNSGEFTRVPGLQVVDWENIPDVAVSDS